MKENFPEEKVLIKSKKYNINKLFIALLVLGIIIGVFLTIFSYFNASDKHIYDDYQKTYLKHQTRGYCNSNTIFEDDCHECKSIKQYPTYKQFFLKGWSDDIVLFFLVSIVSLELAYFLIWLQIHKYELTITNKRVYGNVAWGKKVEIPINSVSATELLKLKGISVSSQSEQFKFLTIKNVDDIYQVINKLLIDRQNEKDTAIKTLANDEIEQIKKYKDLLDDGIITQEEFEVKKKQLLNL